MNLPIELKTRIYEHISLVQQHLGELPADEKREILQSIETHAYDALAARSNGEPTLEVLEAIIAEMDPPESYGSAIPLIASSSGSSISSRGKILFFGVIGTLCVLFIAIWLADPFSSQWMDKATPVENADPAQAAPPGTVLNESKPTPFVRNSPFIGKWNTIDFVSSISEFNPSDTNWKEELELKGLQFFNDGKTDKTGWIWKSNSLFHSGDQSEAELKIVTINRTEYLLLEWISGDVLLNKEKPKYYVLKRGTYIDPSIPKTITEGVGWDALHIGATRAELIAEFGHPDHRNSKVMAWKDKNIMCHLDGGKKSDLHKAVQLNFGSEFSGTTSKSIKVGSTEEEVLAAYGNPERISTSRVRDIRPGARGAIKTMTWPEIGIQITISSSSEVRQIDIIKPYIP
ncbi:MAG: hypothetical protein V3V05_13080 [Pontiella sp.]